jgi:hypothetical protein
VICETAKAEERRFLSPALTMITMLTACAAFAHGCHTGDHGDADLVIRAITAVAPSPAADAQ